MSIWYDVNGLGYKSLSTAAMKAIKLAHSTDQPVQLVEYEFSTAEVISAVTITVSPHPKLHEGDRFRHK